MNITVTSRQARKAEGRFTRVARAFSRSRKVRVRFIGSRCSAWNDPKSDRWGINIPTNADHLQEADQRVLEGMLDHEWSHIEQEVQAARIKSCPSPMRIKKRIKDKREALLFNLWEDMRIEAESARRYPGVSLNLEEMYRHLNRVHAKQARVQRGRLFRELVSAIWIRSKGDAFPDYIRPEVRAIVDGLDDLIRRGSTARSASEARRASAEAFVRIKDILDREREAERKRKEQAESAGGEQSDDDDSGSIPASSDDGDEDAGQEPDDGDKDAAPGGEEPDGWEGTEREWDNGTDDDEPTQPLTDQIEEASKGEAEASGRHLVHPDVLEEDTVTSPQLLGYLREDDERAYKALVDEVRPQIAAIRTRLVRRLLDQRVSRLVGEQESGGLDAGSLYRLRTGERDVFQAKVKGRDVNAVVGLLTDQSGSMSRDRIENAKKAAVALAEAIRGLDIPFAVWGFRTQPRFSERMRRLWKASLPDRMRYNRWNAQNYFVYKGFQEEWCHVRSRINQMGAGGSTIDGEAIGWAGDQLLEHPVRRKVLIVLLDGKPQCPNSLGSKLRRHTQETIQRLEVQGVTIIGIGIQSDHVKHYFSCWDVVNEIDELPAALVNAFRGVMVR